VLQVPILLTSVFTDSLLPASAFPFFTQLSCVVFGALHLHAHAHTHTRTRTCTRTRLGTHRIRTGTMMGKMVDDTDRKRVITISLVVQNVCVIICAAVLYFILPFGAPHPPLDNWRFDLLFAILVFVRHTPHARTHARTARTHARSNTRM
jgi:hypothetical protein